MNERIQKLAEQAGYHPDVYELCKPGMEKFAELIIRECAELADNQEDYLTAKIIKQHFGVKDV